MYILSAFALIGFIFRLQALNFKGYLKFYDYNKELAKKYEIYSMCTESRRYELYYLIGMLLSVAVLVSSLVDNFILTSTIAGCCSIYALLYGLKFERYIQKANKNEKRCVYLLNHIIKLDSKEDCECKANAKDADDIHTLYLCCNHDKMTLLFDLVPLFLLVLSFIISFT